jgi:hypothetical protein
MTNDNIIRHTTGTTFFVNFDNHSYCCTFPASINERKWLVEHNFVVIDEAIAAPIIVLNDNGCTTEYCCSGHIGGVVCSPYILFTKISKEIDDKFKKTRLWGREVDERNRVTWRARASTLKEWRYALNELYAITDSLNDNFKRIVKIIARYRSGKVEYQFMESTEIDSWCNEHENELLCVQLE